tara:strand:- start:858 stop:2597 length:1740 start_codon:yes stop_codon:yes gene_type:complete
MIAVMAGPICACIFIIILFFIAGSLHWNSSPCRKEETCVKENIIGEWEEEAEPGILGKRNESGCYVDFSGVGTCVCKQQYGGEKCEIEVCTEAERSKCNGGIAVPVNNIGGETNGTCIVSTPNGTESECVCNPGFKTSSAGSTIECDLEKSLIIPEMNPDYFTGETVYNGTIFTEGTCDSITCQDGTISSRDSAAGGLATGAITGRLMGQWTKKYGTGHIFTQGIYKDKRSMDIWNGVVQRACTEETASSGSTYTDITSGTDIGISDLSADEITMVNSWAHAHGASGGAAESNAEICNAHNIPTVVHGPSFYRGSPIAEVDLDNRDPRTETPMGECVFDSAAVSASTDGAAPFMEALLGRIKYMFVKFDGYQDDYGHQHSTARDLLFGPLSPIKIGEKFEQSVTSGRQSWSDIGRYIIIHGLPVSDIAGGGGNARIKPIPEELIMELCSGCWEVSDDSLTEIMSAADDDEANMLGQDWKTPIIFERSSNGCRSRSGNHYSSWKPTFSGSGYCDGAECNVLDCCTMVAGDVDRCNFEVNRLPEYNYCDAFDAPALVEAARETVNTMDDVGRWAAGFFGGD